MKFEIQKWLQQGLLFVVHHRGWERTCTRLRAISTAGGGWRSQPFWLPLTDIWGQIATRVTLCCSSL